MARRRQKQLIEPKVLASLLVAMGGILLIGRMLSDLPSGSADAFGLIVFIVVLVVLLFIAFRLFRHITARKALFHKVSNACQLHMPALLRRRAQLVRLDPYGKPQVEKWANEIGYFIAQHIEPGLTAPERIALRRNHNKVEGTIKARVETAMRTEPPFQGFSDDMTPSEFETFCAEELRRAGWNARVTMQSRDQGVDVIAEKNGRRIVLQCKLYARPVGNKAVQEATAAKAYEQAGLGIVVSNNRYTDSAEQLASANGILLLHYRDLQNLDALLVGRIA